VLVAGLLLVAVILLFEFGDWRAPLLTSLMSITALTGVFGALMATGMTLNISSFVGAIMMVGIVGENAIFVIHEARLGLRRGDTVPEAWAAAARHRARPVAMTVLATALPSPPWPWPLARGHSSSSPWPSGSSAASCSPARSYCSYFPHFIAGRIPGGGSGRPPGALARTSPSPGSSSAALWPRSSKVGASSRPRGSFSLRRLPHPVDEPGPDRLKCMSRA